VAQNAQVDVKNKMGEMHTDPGIIGRLGLAQEEWRSPSAKYRRNRWLQNIRSGVNSPDDDNSEERRSLRVEIGEELPRRKVLRWERYESRYQIQDQDDGNQASDRQFGDLIL